MVAARSQWQNEKCTMSSLRSLFFDNKCLLSIDIFTEFRAIDTMILEPNRVNNRYENGIKKCKINQEAEIDTHTAIVEKNNSHRIYEIDIICFEIILK